MNITDTQLNDAEESVTKLAEATGLDPAVIVDVLNDGFSIRYRGKLSSHIHDIIEELRATFDVY